MRAIRTTSGLEFEGRPGQSLVDAAMGVGIFYPYSCKSGRCKTCKCKVVSGATKLLGDEVGLSDGEKQEGWILGCVREAVSDLTISVAGASKFSMPLVRMIPCRISVLDQISVDVMRVALRLPPNSKFEYYPGQYVEVVKGGVRRSYSVANDYSQDCMLELHVKRFSDGLMSEYWFEQAKINDLLRLNGPLGTFFLRDFLGVNLIFLATGTGFAPVAAMLGRLSSVKPEDRPRSVCVYWGGRVESDFYAQAPDIGFPYIFKRVISRGSVGDALGYVQAVCLADTVNFENTMVFACGSNSMIEDAKCLLVEAGLDEADFYSDAFVCSASK